MAPLRSECEKAILPNCPIAESLIRSRISVEAKEKTRLRID
jgi:hypothetical protein